KLQFSFSSARPDSAISESTPASTSPSTIISSVSGSLGDTSIALQFAANEEESQPIVQQREAPPVQQGFSPVRAPYAVKLTDPILMFRGPEPVPNIVVINHLR